MNQHERQRFMAKSATRRPLGRNPVIAVRVPPPLHQEIAEDAKASERTMSEEMATLLRQALDHRKRFPTSAVAQAVESATLSFLIGGANYARDIAKLTKPWPTDLESRRAAALAACQSLLSFVSADPSQQRLTVDVLMGRIAFQAANFPRPDPGSTP
jgi:hypothetical protein